MQIVGLLLLCLLLSPALALDSPLPSSDKIMNSNDLRQRLQNMYNEDSQPDTREAILGLFLDRRHLAEVLARVPFNDIPVQLRYRDLKIHLKDRISHERLMELGEAQDLHGWVSVSALSEFEPKFNEDTLSLSLTTPPDQRVSRQIDLVRRQLYDASTAIAPSGTAAYINFNNIYNVSDSGHNYRLDMDAAVHVHDWIAEGRVDAVTNRNQLMDFYSVRAIHDWPEKAVRLTMGETQSFNSRLLLSDRIYGVKYARDFNLQPTKVTEPTSEYTFFLERDSTVQVYVNGQEVTTLKLVAGPQSVLNFPLQTGLNENVLKNTNELGEQQTLMFNSVRGPNLLAPGLTEFAYSAGVRGQGSQFSDEWVASAFYRIGLASMWTLSAESQVDQEHGAIAIGNNIATPWAYGACDTGLSYTRWGFGGAGKLTVTRTFDAFSLTGRVDYRTSGFLTQGQSPSSTRIKLLNEVTVLVPQIWRALSLRFSGHDSRRYHGESSRRAELAADWRIGSRWQVSSGVRWSPYNSPQIDFRASVTFSYYTESYRQNHMAGIRQGNFSGRSSVGGDQRYWPCDWNLVYGYLRPDEADDSHSVRGSVNYEGNRFSSYYLGQVGDLGDDNDLRHNLNLSAGLAYTDGAWGVGRPIRDAFALVDVGEALGDVDLRVLNSGKTWLATPRMPAVVNSLHAYYPENVNVEAADEAYDVDNQHYFLMPRYRSGHRLSVKQSLGDGGALVIRGRLVDHKGQPVPLKLLVVTKLEGVSSEVRSFTNSNGEFRVPGLSLGARYKIEVWQSASEKIRQSSLVYEADAAVAAGKDEELDVGDLNPVTEYREPQEPMPSRPRSTPDGEDSMDQQPEEQMIEQTIEVSGVGPVPFPLGEEDTDTTDLASVVEEPAVIVLKKVDPVPVELTPALPKGSLAALVKLVPPPQTPSEPSFVPTTEIADYTLGAEKPVSVYSIHLPKSAALGLDHIMTGPMARLRTGSRYRHRFDLCELVAAGQAVVVLEPLTRGT